MKKLIIFVFVLLNGCSSPTPVIVKPEFPKVPSNLLETCPDLQKVDPTTEKLSEVLPVIVDNYGTYYTCKIKINAWIEWYKTEKILEENAE